MIFIDKGGLTIYSVNRYVRFVRRYTLASGGPYCNCGYQKMHVSPDL